LENLVDNLLSWFKIAGRDLPWRKTLDPYPVWLSEVILQQTRVAQGEPYFHRFLDAFPTLFDLAGAPEEKILELWQGLGYYSRARNLHQTAKCIVEDYHGVFPDTFQGLLRLKGIGPYTAAAIASFCFGEHVPVVDGNVIRVFTRFLAIEEDVRLPAVQELVRRVSGEWLPQGQSWTYNQAIMELGALVCLPKNPICSICPLAPGCAARINNLTSRIPFKSKAPAKKKRYLNYLLLVVNDAFFFVKRGPKDIWEGLFEPMLVESDRVFLELDAFQEQIQLKFSTLIRQKWFPTTRHLLSHQELFVTVCMLECTERPTDLPPGRWVARQDLEALPKPVIFSKILGLEKRTPLPLNF
jgi:A/G-specific adenine glycosylase